MRLPHVLLLFGHRYNPAIHRAVARHAGQARWHLSMLIHPTGKPLTGLRSLQGVLLADRFPDAVVDAVVQNGVPCVNLSSDPESFSGSRVTGDNRAIGRLAAEYLLGRQHRHFAFYGDDLSAASRARGQSFATALKSRGLDSLEITSLPGDRAPSIDWAAELRHLQVQLERLPAPAAVFCFNDLYASRLFDAALQAGRLVPEELAILGVDDDPLVCETVAIPLSSVRHALEKVGAEAASLLEKIMLGQVRRPTQLILRPDGITSRRSTEHFAVAHPALQAILLHIDRHHRQAIGLDQVAASAGLSPRTVQQLLKDHLQSTFTAEIQKRRLSHAQRLLAGTSLPIADIAVQAGFSSATYFHHAFRQRTGHTPRAYRLVVRAHQGAGNAAAEAA